MKKFILLLFSAIMLSSCANSQNNNSQEINVVAVMPEQSDQSTETKPTESSQPVDKMNKKQEAISDETALYGKKRFFSRPKGTRSIWVWSNSHSIIEDVDKQRAFFRFLKNPNEISPAVTNVYLDCSRSYLINETFKKQLAILITNAHREGICIQFLAGNPSWSYQNRTVLSIIEAMSRYNQEVPPEARFDGIHFDIEPHTMTMWGKDDRLRDRFLKSVKLYGEKMREYNPDIVFGLDLPIFWNEDEIRIFLEATDYLTLMNYTDNATAMTNRAEKFLRVADKMGKKIESGIETQAPSKQWGVTPPVTFYDEGYEIMENRLTKAEKKMGQYSSFIGFAIHYFESYRTMSRDRVIIRDTQVYPEQPTILIPQRQDPIAIDANLDDWLAAGTVEINEKKQVIYEITPGRWNGPDDLSCTTYLFWDNETIYMAFDVKDDVIFQKHTGSQMVTGDHIELWFDTNFADDEGQAYTSEDDFQIGISPGDFNTVKPSMTIWLPGDETEFDLTSINYAVAKSDTGYQIEMSIPFSFFHRTAPEEGEHMRINIDPSDTDGPNDDQEVLMSSSVCRIYGNPRSFRRSMFGK